MLDTTGQRISDHLVRLVQILFGLVIAQSFLRHRDVILSPFAEAHQVSGLALLAVYVMTVFSWIDWHTTVTLFPYDLSPQNTRRTAEIGKLVADLLIVSAYAFALLTIEDFEKNPVANLTKYLAVYPGVYGLYLAAGVARTRSAWRVASNFTPILSFFALFLGLAIAYANLKSLGGITLRGRVGNLVTLGLVVILTVGYRWFRARHRARRRSRDKAAGLRIGVDVDGVLADQIHGIIPRVKKQHDVFLRPEDVVHWALPVGESDIAKEILAAMEGDSDYVRTMRPHPGTVEAVRELWKENVIVIITARPTSVQSLTEAWLKRNGVPYDELVSTKEAKKSLFRLELLIDDYLGNVGEFLQNTDGLAILVDRPWNRDGRDVIGPYFKAGRAFVIAGLEQARDIIDYARVLKQLELRPLQQVETPGS